MILEIKQMCELSEFELIELEIKQLIPDCACLLNPSRSPEQRRQRGAGKNLQEDNLVKICFFFFSSKRNSMTKHRKKLNKNNLWEKWAVISETQLKCRDRSKES